MAAKIFVGNLNFKTTRDALETLFSQVGTPKDVFLPTERETGRPRGFAFVEYESDEEAAQAIEKFNGYELDGRALRVNAAEERSRPSGFGGGARPSYGDDRGGGGGRFGGGGNPKGSRRNIRAKKRSL